VRAQAYNRFDDEEDDLDVLEPMQNEPENF
jgi:hypothetical protein